ncbi:SARP family transcriptional regulator [Longispora fulva]|uniref:DNA-binding SARP family transcriptional activator/tetratricopeptide (TPR) repeat protein n=1 Tax=Longispora fulva TaxID=619741 RepID=A0A8J7GEQ1_9ACTN|nr:tetratricopeptide repeat protein [Longispora fulva]MBG6136510.1 DNA-binding SARP family transcriptional activator/tetratricopeptide (TPR) repeat protein [Longispora fulva]GIG59679.1 SARP family transcriptional regulator [Longispora fulva]
MRVGLLGPVTVWQDGATLPLGPAMQRAVLALLALDAGRPVSTQRLVDALWGDEPPDRAVTLVQGYVSRLRALLRPADLRITRHASGYVIDVAPEDVDVTAFRARVASAETGTDPAPLRAALALWRGEALADLRHTPVLDRLRAGLEAERLDVWEECLDRVLRAGRHLEVLGELTDLCAEHPFRPRPLPLLMVALYRAGRQAEALTWYATARRRYADELGLDPTPEATAVHGRILRGDPDLDLPPAAEAPPVRPARLLPYAVRDFTGREAELRQLLGLAGGTASAVVISAIDGMPGVGKTTIAVHAAHALADRFPDGQYFVDLHGFTPGLAPMDTSMALGLLLRAAGVPAERIPVDLQERSALWRSELADRRVLILLDNAASAQQVRPLLPGSPGSLVLVTSRRRLRTLDGAEALSLDVLPQEEAHDLFVAAAGPRALAEPDAVADVVELCGRLPLALRIAAARVGTGPAAVARLATHLRAALRRLDALAVDDRDVSATFTLSYRALEPAQQRMFRLLGLHPGHHFGADSASALADIDQGEATALLDALVSAHLLQRHADDRYTFHDLLRVFAGTHATPAAEHRAALDRLLDHYGRTALAAAHALGLGPFGEPPPPTPPPAAGWLDAERAGLIAAAGLPGAGPFALGLARALSCYLEAECHHADALSLYDHALRALPTPAEEAELHRHRALILLRTGAYQTSEDAARHSLRICRDTGDEAGEGRSLTALARVFTQRGEPERSLEHSTRALDLHRRTADRVAEGATLNNLGSNHARLGNHAIAEDYLRQAVSVNRQTGNRRSEATAWCLLGIIDQQRGHHDTASAHLREALSLYRATGDRAGEGTTLANLGLIHGLRGRYSHALDTYRQAHGIHHEIGNRAPEGYALAGIGNALSALGHHDQAIEHHRRALDLGRALHEPNLQAQALQSLGAAHLASGDADQALHRHGEALGLATASGDVFVQAQANEGIGRALEALGRFAEARSSWQRALDTYTSLGAPQARDLLDKLAT